jgi:hypothetical protein
MGGLTRRGLLASATACALAPRAWAQQGPSFLSARDDDAGRHFATRFAADGTIAFDLKLPARGHGIALSPDGRTAVAVARRPGRYLLVFDRTDGTARRLLDAPAGHFFCGHAAFARDGRLLYATETRSADAAGLVGVYDASAGWRRLATWPTRGCDPHELVLEGESLIVANGGFRQDGDATIDPSLVRLDARTGSRQAQVRPPDALRQVSLRHLAIARGAVFVAGQYAGPMGDRPPLVARWDAGGLAYLDLGSPATERLANYCGSIAADVRGTTLCVASPRGGRAVVFDAAGRVLGETILADGCGVAATAAGGFLLTSGRGALRLLPDGDTVAVPGARWDNHAVAL